MNKVKEKIDFENIVSKYKANKKQYPDRYIDFCKQQKSLVDAIEVAAKSINAQNKIHSHQRRIGRLTLNIFAELLKTKEEEISLAKSFDKLLSIILSVRLAGVGELAYYDISTRIAAYLKLNIENVYMHAGTRKGARELLGNKINGKKLFL
ncbi:hypothetical protein [Limibacterium fermenti]|uniref:hypothetical protein n=1 Tax=Limibacterium fermenti TaxID=3229863 RepID=UPI003A626554